MTPATAAAAAATRRRRPHHQPRQPLPPPPRGGHAHPLARSCRGAARQPRRPPPSPTAKRRPHPPQTAHVHLPRQTQRYSTYCAVCTVHTDTHGTERYKRCPPVHARLSAPQGGDATGGSGGNRVSVATPTVGRHGGGGGARVRATRGLRVCLYTGTRGGGPCRREGVAATRPR